MPMRSLPLSLLVATACSSPAWSQEPTTSSPVAGDSSCVAALDSLQSIFRHDYPGYREKVAGHDKQLAALGDSVRAVARRSDSAEACIPALRRWARFFKDPHVTGPWQSARPTAAQAASSGTGQATGQAMDDPHRPSIEFLDGRTAALRLPSFDSTYKPVVDSLIAAHGSQLRSIPYLIIDVRGNGGGYTGSYASITPLVYSGPIHEYGTDVWTSPANVAYYHQLVRNSFLSAADRTVITSFLAQAEQHVNQFVELSPDTIIERDTVFSMPRRVAVLVDSACASSCEEFLLEVRQSSKVTLMGTHSRGMNDYGELRGVWLPGWRRVSLPTNRKRGPRIDNVGIVPAVPIPSSERDTVAFARRYLSRRSSQ
jgi:hypothetical protein